MAVLALSPTRMNLLSLKKKLKTAQKGHKLLKDKRDGLMKKFMEIIKEARELRIEVENEMGSGFTSFLEASQVMSSAAIKGALTDTSVELTLDTKILNVMSVKIPQFEAHFSGDPVSFGTLGVSEDLPLSLKKFQKILPKLLKLAGMEKAAESLAKEIEVTRRRVSALEHRMIPDLNETIRFIALKLDENARTAVVSVMRIKAMIQAKEA